MTPHRMLYEALTLDEYKRFCINFDPSFFQNEFFEATDVVDALKNGFCWGASSEDYSYWEDVYEILYRAKQ